VRPPAILRFHIGVELKPAPINPKWILEGSPRARNRELTRSDDSQATTLVWDCTPGKFMWHYDVDETIYILDGRLVLDDGIEAPKRFGPGDVVFFPAGAAVKWHVEEHVHKLAFLHRPLPKSIRFAISPIGRLVRFARRAAVVGRLTSGSVNGWSRWLFQTRR
jgi:uncharacterized protein